MVESIPEKDQFLTAYPNYVLRETVTYPNGGVSRFYDDGVDMVIIDDEICSCRDGEQIFPYTLITDKQNHYMKIYRRVFRFLGFDPETIEKCLQKNRQEVLHFTKKISERGEHADSSPLELLFEQNFTDVYGMRALKYLQKEFRISDEDGNNYFLDYLIDTADSRVAIEENGIHYHHPQLIGIEGYRKQLRKQNTCALWGLKLYRFSTEDCRFKDRIEDDIRSYLGKDTSGFREAGLLLERKTELYEHQEISLAQIPGTAGKRNSCIPHCITYRSGKIPDRRRRYSEICSRKRAVPGIDPGTEYEYHCGLERENRQRPAAVAGPDRY